MWHKHTPKLTSSSGVGEPGADQRCTPKHATGASWGNPCSLLDISPRRRCCQIDRACNSQALIPCLLYDLLSVACPELCSPQTLRFWTVEPRRHHRCYLDSQSLYSEYNGGGEPGHWNNMYQCPTVFMGLCARHCSRSSGQGLCCHAFTSYERTKKTGQANH